MIPVNVSIDPRITRTRQRLIDAFNQLMQQKSFDEITVRDLARQAGVNRATFYAHFPDKHAILDAMMAISFADTLHRWVVGPLDDPEMYLERLFLAITDQLTMFNGSECQDTFSTFEAVIEVQIKAQVCKHIQGWFGKHIPAQVLRYQPLELSAALVSWALYGAAQEWKTRARTQAPATFGHQVIPLISAMVRKFMHER
ncbi:TetR/AcrR family transcriptional regulator [Herpetosiphon sp. NSE202]|uniref:TetR/AcrR family transcriptional regulator n=1 Tax=Herpetosiphon sp. NSE202 TaxID=3351349 RepID=UPI00363316DD